VNSTARNVATASNGDVAQAAATAFPQGNAVDAVVTGVFAAAALSPSVLLGPVQLLVGGAGTGLRAIDGRTRQPGLGVPRPRGFRDEDPVPIAARVGVPALPSALAAALATCGSATLARVLGPAVELARVSTARRAFLKRLSQRGPSYLADETVAVELIALAGRIAGGVLTAEDLEAVRPTIDVCEASSAFGLPSVVIPWAAASFEGLADTPNDASNVHIVAAADDRGVVAIACYEVRSQGVVIDEFGLEAPLTATPVRRGQTRVRPGEACHAAAPIALVASDGLFDTALGLVDIGNAERTLAQLLRHLATSETFEAAIRAPRAPHEGAGHEAAPLASDVGFALGVHRSKRTARVLSDPRRA
jgi:hypothetical protein